MTTTAIRERRHEPRTTTHVPVNVSTRDRWSFPIDHRMGRTLDLSHNGARIELDRVPALGERLTLNLGLGRQTVEVQGRVRSIDERTDGSVALGIQFLNLDRPTYELIHRYLKLSGQRARRLRYRARRQTMYRT